jgi:hypothetical protein
LIDAFDFLAENNLSPTMLNIFISPVDKLRLNSHCRATDTHCNWYSAIGHIRR